MSDDYWSVYAVADRRQGGTWDWEAPVLGDSLQGWWPIRLAYDDVGPARTDRNRPWWAIDIGNQANYRINAASGRTFGVVGVWHVDGGGFVAPPSGIPPAWTPYVGGASAWMGLRAHGDNSYLDPVTNNPFNADVLQFNGANAPSQDGNDKQFPGYGSQMDQMLYRDIDMTGKEHASITVSFAYRTEMSTGFDSDPSTRTGWFDSDPLGFTSGPINPQLNNFISSSDAGDALAPRDSFMVYIGAGIEDYESWSPAASNFNQGLPPQPIHDLQRRWFGEVLNWNRDPNGNPYDPQPLYYRELLSVAGSSAGWQPVSFTIPGSSLEPLVWNSKLRLLFRAKTNRSFDDEASPYSSGGCGAVQVDDVRIQIGGNPEYTLGAFEDAGEIDNRVEVSALDAWKSTGKPPAIYHHAEMLSNLAYEDLCGQPGDASRVCNVYGGVISAGNHDESEATGGWVDGAAERERADGMISPTIVFADDDVNPETPNAQGLYGIGGNGGVRDVMATDDYYIDYEIYTGVFDLPWQGNLWFWGAQCYPALQCDGSETWGQLRYPDYQVFFPNKSCFRDLEPLRAQGLMRTSNASGIPDSLRIFLGKVQQCFRFGISTGCSPTDGCYWDNVSLSIIDGAPALMSVDIWDWLNDAFPANETPGLPGNGAQFDTAAALVKTGRNIAQETGSPLRFDVPGDSVVIVGTQGVARVDMVFRILPGPGNYEPVGRPDVGTITRRPDSRALVTDNDGSFWDEYRRIPGDFASPNASALHHAAAGGWDPNVWNGARCDTAEMNLMALQARGIFGGPPDALRWMSTLHESDPHFNALGIVKNLCFVTAPTAPVTSVVCDGTVPAYIQSRPEHWDVTGITKEFTKIIPDGLLAPGAHVEYFFRCQGEGSPGPMAGMVPDTSVVSPQPGERSADGHRWQQFGVLPDRWKEPTYRHPVTREFGHGPACLLVVDHNDRRGNERAWVGVADTIGATAMRYWGAHNGWHALGGADLSDPAGNRRGSDGQPGFIPEHLGQPGSGGTWDMYQVKGSESLTAATGTIGSRRANRSGGGGQYPVIEKSSRQGPTAEMLETYYAIMLFLSGDLSRGVLGPFNDRSQDDAGIVMDWLASGASQAPNRGFWAMGDGFAESAPSDLMLNYLGCDILHPNYSQYSNNAEHLAGLYLRPEWQSKLASQEQRFGMRNVCLWTNDVLTPAGVGLPYLAKVTSEYDHRYPYYRGMYPAPAGVYKNWDPQSPWMSLVDGWNLANLTGPDDIRTLDRSGYFFKIFSNVWFHICTVNGTPIVALDAPNVDESVFLNLVSLRNNPAYQGRATIHLSISRADRVEVAIYDIGGRLVRTLANRRFTAGVHDLTWDGMDDHGRRVANGVYFTRVKYQDARFVTSRKITVLR
jgi:hypothetical protein